MGTARTLIALFLGTLLSACTPGGSSEKPPEVRKGTVEDLNRCVHKPNEGSDALMTLVGKSQIVDSGFFGKKMNLPDLAAVLDASAESTIRYAKAIGLNVFKTPYKEGERICPTFATIDYAPERFQSIWTEASGGDTSGGTLLGLYFDYPCLPNAKVPAGGKRCSNSKVAEPVVLVTEATDKWTLVHEMMHHNFKKTTKESGEAKSDNTLLAELTKAADAVEKAKADYTALENRQDLETLILNLKLAISLALEAVSRGKLEETAIEGLLIDLWTSDQLHHVVTTGSSVWYMGVGADAAVQQIPDIKPYTDFIRAEIEEHFWNEYTPQVDEIDAMPVAFTANIKQAIKTAGEKLKERGIAIPQERGAERRMMTSATQAPPSQAAVEAHMKNHENPALEKAKKRLFKVLTAPVKH